MMDQQAFLTAAALRRKTVSVRGLTALVREVSLAERDEFQKIRQSNPQDAPLFLIRSCVINEDGSPFFSADANLAGMSTEVIDALGGAILTVTAGEDPKND
jgi:hypothetical protein